MKSVEATTNTGIFIEDLNETARQEFGHYLPEFVAGLDLPHQVDEWGCVSATGAFIINQVSGETATSAAELDTAMGREPNEPGNSSKLSPEILRRGLSLEVHEPYSPLAEPAARLAHGEISFDEYLTVYERHYGSIPTSDYALYRDYYAQSFVPSWLASEERFKGFKATGQMVTNNNSDISKSLLESLLNKGKYLFGDQVTEGQIGSHAIALFRPELTLPALVFVPSTIHEDPQLNSRIFGLSEIRYNAFRSSAIGAVALWDK